MGFTKLHIPSIKTDSHPFKESPPLKTRPPTPSDPRLLTVPNLTKNSCKLVG